MRSDCWSKDIRFNMGGILWSPLVEVLLFLGVGSEPGSSAMSG